MTTCDQQDHRIIHVGNVSRRSLAPPPAKRRVSDGIRSDYSQLCPVKPRKIGCWPDHLAQKTSSTAWLLLWGKNSSLKPVWKASLLFCHFSSYQAPLDTLRYRLLSGSLDVVSSPGWARPAPSALAHRTSASAPLVARAELPTGCLCPYWWGAEEGKTGWRTPDVISLPPICWLSNSWYISACSWPSLLPGHTALFPKTSFLPEYYWYYL